MKGGLDPLALAGFASVKPQPDPTRRTTMTKITLNAFSLSLLALLAVACGDAGDAQFDEDPGFGEELIG